MSLGTFQAALARMVSEPGFRDRVRREGSIALGPDLTLREQRRLLEAAIDPGVEVTMTLISSFRLGKILTLLPLTRTLLGDSSLVRHLQAFWAAEPPRSFYALDECVAFCDYLLDRPQRGAYTEDVVGLERAVLTLRRARSEGDVPPAMEVRFRHDPAPLFGALLAGRRPRSVPQRSCVLLARLAPDGSVDWTRPPAPPASRAGGYGELSPTA